MNEKYYEMIIAMTRQQSKAKLLGKPCDICMGYVTLIKQGGSLMCVRT